MGSFERYYRELWEGKRRSPGDLLLVGLLTPLSLIYSLAVRVRAQLYAAGIRHSRRLGRPVVSVGNLSVGGTGKTPMVALLARDLIAGGRRVAVLTRGYGGTTKGGCRVVSDGTGLLATAAECGDEPCLLARSVSGLIVVVGSDRFQAGRMALERFSPDLFILDDGFQHLRLHRDLNILLLDGRRPFGNGRLLPAGLLREPVSAVRRADLVVLTRCGDTEVTIPVTGVPVCRSSHRLKGFAPLDGGPVAPFSALRGRRGVACAGIADPGSFFSALREAGVELSAALAFTDHCRYGEGEMGLLKRAFVRTGADFLITTEKDAVKLSSFGSALGEAYAAVLEIELHDPAVLTNEVEKLL